MSENKDPKLSDDGKGTPDLPKVDTFDADAARKLTDNLNNDQMRDKFIGGVEQVFKANAEAKEFRLKADAIDKAHKELLKTIEDSKQKTLEENQKFEELYKTEKEKNESMNVDYNSLKQFKDDQVHIMELKIVEMEKKLSTNNKGLWESFKGIEGTTHAKKLEFLSQLIVEDGIKVNDTRSKGGAMIDASKMSLDQKNAYFKEHGKLPV